MDDGGGFPLLYKQQSRQRYAASGFAFVPHTVPLRHRWVVEPQRPDAYKRAAPVRPRKNSARTFSLKRKSAPALRQALKDEGTEAPAKSEKFGSVRANIAMKQFNLETQAWEGVEETKTFNALEYLQSVHRNPAEPEGKRMRAAIESFPYENPKLSAVAVGHLTREDFFNRLEGALERSDRAKLSEGQLIERVD